MRIKKSAVATATVMFLGTLSTAANANLVITEYIEGSSSNKALEISNVGTSTLDLDANVYKLTLFSNGKTDPGNTETLTGTLPPGKSIVFHNSGAADAFKVGNASTITYFNGDDALVLTKDDAVIDRFGKLGEDPGSAWTDPNNTDFSSANKTLRRKATVTTGDTDAAAAFPTGDQWLVFDTDTSDGLGCAGESACSAEATPGLLLITEYIEGSSSNKAIEISNVGGTAIDLDANVYKLTLFGNGKTEPGNTETLTGTLEPGNSLVFHNSGAADAFKVGNASTVTYFNGDDALILTKDDVVIDRFGKRGEDPGSAWTDPNDANFSTANKTLRRKDNVTAGDTVAEADFPGVNNQWTVFDVDTSDGLGCAGESACDGSVTPPEPEPETGPCTNCETLTPVADPTTFNAEIYYSDVLSGDFANADELKNALSAIIAKDHKYLTYKQVWSTLTFADQDPANDKNVIEIYTGASISKYDNQTSGSGAGKWNREHVWAKSHGFPSDSQWGYTDAHHLRPSDPGINTARSNNDFGACSDTGEEVLFNGQGTGNYLDKTTDCWEPRDEVKGDVARMIMYMDTRYQGTDTATTNMPDLVAVDRLTTTAEDSEPLIGTLCTLYAWNKLDAVDSYEQNRNNQVYKYQGNRNPFIDRPELVQQVYGAACDDDPNPGLIVEGDIVTPDSVTEGAAYIIDASEIKAGEGVALTYKWEQIVAEEKLLVGDKAILSLTAPMVKADETLNFTLTISDGKLETTKAISLLVTNVPLTLDVTFTGNTQLTEGDNTTITATVADAPEGTSYSWKQVSGDTAVFTGTGLTLDVTTPSVSIDQVLVFELTATVGEESVSKSVSIEVKNTEEPGWTKPESAGSLGGLITLLLPLLWWRRRQG
ncbi:endonuclease [Shewanella pneumatophori]|uniref:Endonuclease n=1 Tax=Shewanella pneumatophori TaxID=314092 RepID=A0A9X2CH29_9GAMM|nr:endonuclease [Shewanella pneumatophori]MCL1139696.1 endonuclease [Shewanella pneumatophori]